MPWTPTSETVEEWGRLQIVINGVDVTFYRDVPTQVRNWSSTEPFDDAVITLTFPQITTFEPLPSWLEAFANIDLFRVKPDGTTDVLWEGLFVREADTAGGSGSNLTIVGMGALYQADLYIQLPPMFRPELRDIGQAIREALDGFHGRPALRFIPPAPVTMGINTRKAGSGQPLLTGYIQDLLASAHDWPDTHWTLMKNPGRVAEIRTKDITTNHWTTHVAQPGVTHRLEKDLTMAPNCVYGEGVGDDQCIWRNAKYPNLHPDAAPVFDGNILTPGETADSMRVWEQRAFDLGYPVTIDGFYDPSEEDVVRQIQRDNGIQVDGAIGPQTWAATFDTGSNAGDLQGAYIAPLAIVTQGEPFLYSANGAIVGDNPNFDPGYVRVERFINYGERVTFAEGIVASNQEMLIGNVLGYAGTINLEADPQEGSRFQMKAGQNILLRGFKGLDQLFHIAQVTVNWDTGSVALVVDQHARDWMNIAAIMRSWRETNDPLRLDRRTYRNSRAVEDRRVPWDCENGSGVIPYHATYQKLWNVLRIPASEVGTIIRSEFNVETPARFSVAVFDREISHRDLRSMGQPTDEGFWDNFDENTGLIIAWGGEDQMAGYYPGAESRGSELTGRMIDQASWYYESQTPPWLWVCIWVESPAVNYCWGRLFPGLN